MKTSPFVYQKSTTSGTGNLTLSLVTGYRTFATAFPGNSASDLFFYEILDKSTGDYEEGLGYLSSGALVRSQVFAGTNGTSKVSFSSNSKEITCDVPSFFQAGNIYVKSLNNDYTILLNDASFYLTLSAATGKTITVPANATTAFPIGTQIPIQQAGAGQVTIAAAVGVTINSPETLKLRKQFSRAWLVKTGTNVWDLEGDLEPATTPVYVPPGAVLDFAGTSAPAGFVLCYGQLISRTTYAALFAAVGTTYGAGDGATTFAVPDCRGRIAAGKDDMGGASANRLTGTAGGVNGDNLGATGGGEECTLTTNEMPNHRHTWSAGGSSGGGNGGALWGNQAQTNQSSFVGGGAAHNNVQPTIIFNKIIKT